MKTVILNVLLILSALPMTAQATDYREIYNCGHEGGSQLVIDRKEGTEGEIQLVVKGEHAIRHLMNSYGLRTPTHQVLEEAGGRIVEDQNGKKMILPALKAFVRNSEFIHIHEGAGFYRYAQVTDPRSVMEIDQIATNTQPGSPVSLTLTEGLYRPYPARTAFSDRGTVRLFFGGNDYSFYNCSEAQN